MPSKIVANHYVEELVLASNFEYEIEFLYMPSIAFPVSEIYFRFNEQNDRDLDTKPTFNLIFAGEEVGRAQNKLFVTVENNPTTKMKCIFPKHRGCFVQPAGKA
jgi:hypothetical protein